MKLLRFFIILFICFSQVKNVSAQFGTTIETMEQALPGSKTLIASSDGNEALKRKLVVVIVEPDNSLMNSLKPEMKRTYVNGINALNNNLKYAITKIWKNTNEVEYKSINEVNAISNKSDYVVAFFFMAGRSSYSNFTGTCKTPTYKVPLRFTKGTLKNDSILNKDCWETSVQFGMAFLNDNALLFSKVLPDVFPTKTDLLLTLQNALLACEDEKMPSSYFSRIKEKTLLIRADMLDVGFNTQEDIKRNYPFPFKIVTRDTLDKYVMERDTNYAFVCFDANYSVSHWSRSGTGSVNAGGTKITYVINKMTFGIGSTFYYAAESKPKEDIKNIHDLNLLPDDFTNWTIPATGK